MNKRSLKAGSLASVAGMLLGMSSVSNAQMNDPFSAQAVPQAPTLAARPADAVVTVSVPDPARQPTAQSPAVQQPQRVGDATRDLLAMQADPARPGTPHHVLGATADRTWKRYLDSFEHPVPVRFDNEVEHGSKR